MRDHAHRIGIPCIMTDASPAGVGELLLLCILKIYDGDPGGRGPVMLRLAEARS